MTHKQIDDGGSASPLIVQAFVCDQCGKRATHQCLCPTCHTGECLPKLLPEGGLSLRDYFAAAAVQSVSIGVIVQSEGSVCEEALAAAAYRLADAMLAARKGGTP